MCDATLVLDSGTAIEMAPNPESLAQICRVVLVDGLACSQVHASGGGWRICLSILGKSSVLVRPNWPAGASKEDMEAARKAEQYGNDTASPAAPTNGKSLTSGAGATPSNATLPSDAAGRPKAAV